MSPPADKSEYKKLLAAVALGDRAALERLYNAISPQLFGVLLRILKNQALAEEALQDVFVKIWQKAGDYNAARGAASTWMFSIARYRALDLLRQRRDQEVGMDDVAETQDLGPGPFDASVNHEVGASLRECLDQLQPGPRACLVLAYCDGYTHEELSSRLGSPMGTVKSWIRRGLESLKRCLQHD